MEPLEPWFWPKTENEEGEDEGENEDNQNEEDQNEELEVIFNSCVQFIFHC